MFKKIKKVIKKNPILFDLVKNLSVLIIGISALLKKRRGAVDHILSTISMIHSSSRIAGKPINITIEPTNYCNLKCPVCETGVDTLGRLKKRMTLNDFKIIIDKLARHTNNLIFYFMGEPFLNKDSYKMIRYAKDIGITNITTCTNGDIINPKKLVCSGIDEVYFQIGGITQKTHQIYRIGSNIDNVFNNLKKTIKLKNDYSLKLRINCGFILMKHNEHEVLEFKKMMSRFGVDQASIIAPCVRTIEQAKEMLPSDKTYWNYDQRALIKGKLLPKNIPKNQCQWIYYSMVIMVNGDVVPCCRDATGSEVMGNLLTQSLDEIWNGSSFREFRTRIHRNQKQIKICKLCSGYGVSEIK